MFTNGMSESVSSEVCLKDVPPEAFKIMMDYFYNGGLNLEDTADKNILLLELLLLADEFGVSQLHQDCCKILLERLSEVVLITFFLCFSMLYNVVLYLYILFDYRGFEVLH